jgi:hypothetical protein
MFIENHEIVMRFDFLFNYDAQFTKIFVDDRFNKIHFFRHFRLIDVCFVFLNVLIERVKCSRLFCLLKIVNQLIRKQRNRN